VIVAAVVGGLITAMIIDIMLARRGIILTGAWQGLLRRGGSPIHAALAWWAMTGGAFVASFAVAAVVSRVTWLYFRSLRWVAAVALTFWLANMADQIPVATPGGASQHSLATLTALAVAMLMAGFGAFFAVRH
jgi:hypothetical protein